MINLESFLVWLGGVVFGLVIGFFFKLGFQESAEVSSSDAEPSASEVEKKSGAAPPVL